ncbi:hypothetical protein ACF0H5_017231 [Mactra antiquata]
MVISYPCAGEFVSYEIADLFKEMECRKPSNQDYYDMYRKTVHYQHWLCCRKINSHSSNFRKALFQIVCPKEELAKRKQSVHSESENVLRRRRNTFGSNQKVCFEFGTLPSHGNKFAALKMKAQSMPNISNS